MARRPTLTLALSSVLDAQVEGRRRAALLKVLRPDFHRSAPSAESGCASSKQQRDGTVIPMPRVIPLPTRPQDDDDPDSAA